MKIFFCLILLTTFIYPQNHYVKFEDLGYSKKETIDSLISEKITNGIDTILILTTYINNGAFAEDSIKDRRGSIPITFMLYRKNGKDFLQMLYKDYISQIKNIKTNNIFKYEFINKTGVIKKETRLRVKAPLEYSFADKVFFISPKIKFYFEVGISREITINADETRRKYREEWINIIKGEFKQLLKELDYK